MKRVFPLILLVLFAASPALAQDGGIWIGVQGEAVIPASGDMTDVAEVGGGGGIKGDFYVGSRLAVRIDASFHRFGNKDTEAFTVSELTVAPWRAGVLYELNDDKARFYVAGMAG
ncbi:MAG: outer membrane beta-barrel protein, partial [Planctomycetota bacterium]